MKGVPMSAKSSYYKLVVRPRWRELKVGWRTLPNLLSLSRVPAAPLVMILWLDGFYLEATLLFGAAMLTDWLDGFVAKRLNQVTKLGQWLDPFTDKLLMMSAGLVVWLDFLSVWLIIWRLPIELALAKTSGDYEYELVKFKLKHDVFSDAKRRELEGLMKSNAFGKAKTVVDTMFTTWLMASKFVLALASVAGWVALLGFLTSFALAVLSLWRHRQQLSAVKMGLYKHSRVLEAQPYKHL